MANDLKQLLEIFKPSFKFEKDKQASDRRPQIGRGFIYEAKIERKGVGTASYYGLTRRSIFTRKSEHVKDAIRLGPLGSAAGGIKEELSFPSKATPLQVLIRTAVGTVRERPERAEKYMTVLERAQPSLFALGEYEKYLIRGRKVDFPDKRRYDTTFGFNLLNQTTGGEGIVWDKVAPIDKAVGAYIYLKEETDGVQSYIESRVKKSKGKYSPEDYLITILFSFYSRKNHLSNPAIARKEGRVGAMIRHLEDYFSFGSAAEIYMQKNKEIVSGTEKNIFLSLISRKTSKDDEDLVKAFREFVVPISTETIEVRSLSIYEHFIGKKTHPAMKRVDQKIKKDMKEYFEATQERFREIIRNNLREKIDK